ncbi:FUN14 domain-containing protein 1-like [Tubulanus polymorphus]|uniref:FUN14 domain-containing protein 1-like n=1 Tax=Tubulanus polymorphus TaxID=672921 RepID=UPI003DA30BC8
MPIITEDKGSGRLEIIKEITGNNSNNSNDWIKKMYDDITKASAAKQITIGGVSGWCAGYLFSKVGKAAATALGGSLLLIQLAQHRGYIKINWTKVEREFNSASHTVETTARNSNWEEYLESTKQFVKDNAFLASGFGGGFLIGLAS